MEYLNYDRVKNRFLSVSGAHGEDFSDVGIFDIAEQYVLSRITVPPEKLDERGLKLCENAAAAVAVYDRCISLCLAERPVMSETGEVSVKCRDSGIISRAEQLRREAFIQLSAAGLAAPYDFAFMGV